MVRRVPDHGFFLLPARGVDLLAEVTLSADERHDHDGEPQVGGRLDGVAGEDAQAAAVGGDIVATPISMEK